MVEWYIYASGPNKVVYKNGTKHEKYWEGDGTVFGRQAVKDNLNNGKQFENDTGLKTYYAEWMPYSNKRWHLNESEVIEFANFFFFQELKPIPWSLNSLYKFYENKKSQWIDYNLNITGQVLNTSRILKTIIGGM